MVLKSIFEKPVDRPIEGVIKADDEASLLLELEEYVLTNQVEKRLESFLDAYNTYEGVNGVWISGFFGSGKSHLLKILALLLENRQIDGVSALDLFLPKCGENEILRGDLKRAVAIPSKSILFNIDQKSDVISKDEIGALLAVFVKVFDEMCGYYGKQGHIAQFERELDSRGMYDGFKEAYKSVAGKEWTRGREQALLESQNIAKAYAQVSGELESAANGILDKYRSQYKVSIEDFSEQVKDYIDEQPSNFRLNFYVDEVGQYIADHVKLMTNLQTVAESLATKCRGRAWVIVTAQEDMSSIVGDMGSKKGDDFSKIQARFANRMKLTSANVAEVIQKRLLMKNDDGLELLSDIYHAESNNFKTLFDFADGSQTYRNFDDRDHFVRSYPFIPYQFFLFQAAITNLSQHSAFEGRHSSVGERSMLEVFQQVAIKISDHELGQLATFDLMYEGIRTTLQFHIQRAVSQAEQNLTNPFAIRLLKALFLVKYVKEFKPTVRNLCVLMLERFSQDLPKLRDQVAEALNLLEQQTYIQRNGEHYEYLTDEEKDVEQEIKGTEVESTDVAAELEKIVFDHVIRDRKIRYPENLQDYLYSKKLDDRLYGREHELSIHVVTPFHEYVEDISLLAMQGMGRDELLVVMPPDVQLVRDITMYKQTEKYIRQSVTTGQKGTVERILTDKGHQNRDRFSRLKQRVQDLLGKAKLFVSGADLEIGGEDAQSRIAKGFHELITRVYPNLRMLRGVSHAEGDVAKYLDQSQEGLFGNDATSLAESEQEVLSFIHSNGRGGVRTTIKTLLERFERKPYGWPYAAVLCTLAQLCVRGKVEVRSDGNILEEKELERALLNTQGHGNVVLEPQVEFTASQVRALKAFYEDFFDEPPSANEAKALGMAVSTKLKVMIHELEVEAAKSTQYPFLNALIPVIEKLNGIGNQPYTWYLTELKAQEDELLDLKEKVIDPVRKFMGGPQLGIFDDAQKMVREQKANFASIEGNEPALLMEFLGDPDCYKGNRMQQVKGLLDVLQKKVSAQIKEEVTQATDTVQGLKGRLCGMGEFVALSEEQQQQISGSFETVIQSIQGEPLIAVIRDTLRRFEDSEYQTLLARVSAWSQPAPKPTSSNPGAADAPLEEQQAVNPVPYVSSRTLQISFDKAWLADEGDVERYLESMRKALLAEIQDGKRIRI